MVTFFSTSGWVQVHISQNIARKEILSGHFGKSFAICWHMFGYCTSSLYHNPSCTRSHIKSNKYVSIGSNPCLKCTPSWQTIDYFWTPRYHPQRTVNISTVWKYSLFNTEDLSIQCWIGCKKVSFSTDDREDTFFVSKLTFTSSALFSSAQDYLHSLLLSESKFFPRLKTWFGCLWLQSIDQYTCFSTSLNSKMFQMSIMEWDETLPASALTVDCWPGSGRGHPMLKVKGMQ